MHGAQRLRDPREHLGLAHPLDGRDLALDEPGHEPALRLDEGDDLRPDADRRCRQRGRVLDAAVDAEQVGVLAGDPQDVRRRPAASP